MAALPSEQVDLSNLPVLSKAIKYNNNRNNGYTANDFHGCTTAATYTTGCPGFCLWTSNWCSSTNYHLLSFSQVK